MEPQEQPAAKRLAGLAALWSLWTAAASWFVYVVGYLALRSELTALGVVADLGLVSERYLYAGARFMFYLFAAVPLAVVCGLLLAGLGGWILRSVPRIGTRLSPWWSRRTGPLIAGITLSVGMIQLVMRQCLAFHDLLLRDDLPGPQWFARMLTASSVVPAEWYFTGLLLGIAAVIGLLACLGSWRSTTRLQRALGIILCVLIGIQISLLPVNYGVLKSARSIPRLAAGSLAPAAGSAWLVWQGATGTTLLVREADQPPRLVALQGEQASRIEIVGHDSLAILRSSAPLVHDRPPRRVPLRSLLAQVAGLHGSAMSLRNSPGESEELRRRGPVQGQIVLVPARGGVLQTVAEDSEYRSPIFLPGDQQILALREEELVRIDLSGGEPQSVAALPDAVKLIGVDREAPSRLFYLSTAGGAVKLAEFDLNALQRRPSSPARDADDRLLLNLLRSENRDYGSCQLFTELQQDPAGAQWLDVFVQCPPAPREKLTDGRPDLSFRQPALSADGLLVAMIRVGNGH